MAIAEASESSDESITSQIPSTLRQSKTLVLCPPSLVDNWVDELNIWASERLLGTFRKITALMSPEARVEAINDWSRGGGVLVIGYHMFRGLVLNKSTSVRRGLTEEQHNATKNLLLKGAALVVADEAHMLKNPKAKLTEAASLLQSKSRLALTGSPLANNVLEYFSMIDWVAPNFLGKLRHIFR